MGEDSDTSGLILAIDPGSSKFGHAVLDQGGAIQSLGVGKSDELLPTVSGILSDFEISTIVLGDGTNSNAYKTVLFIFERKIIMIDESHSTEEARKVYFELHPAKGLAKLMPASLRTPKRPIDDCAAVVLGRRYLKVSQN